MGRTKDILPKLNGDLFLVDKSDISSSQSWVCRHHYQKQQGEENIRFEKSRTLQMKNIPLIFILSWI